MYQLIIVYCKKNYIIVDAGDFSATLGAAMTLLASVASEGRFLLYIENLSDLIGYADRMGQLRNSCFGLLLPGQRKSVEVIAALIAPVRTAVEHQSLLHFVGQTPWSDEKMLAEVQNLVLPAVERNGAIEAWIIDDTGFPKKGSNSVSVRRQYCNQPGKHDNCQVAVSLSITNHAVSPPMAYQLYLPENWAKDQIRRNKSEIRQIFDFSKKSEIVLAQFRAARAAGIAAGFLLVDGVYGLNTSFRGAPMAFGLVYSVDIMSNTIVWSQGQGLLPLKEPKEWSGQGPRPTRMRRDAERQPLEVQDLALNLPVEGWENITWRESSNGLMTSRLARARVRAAHRDEYLKTQRPEKWLLIDWLEGDSEPTKYWLSTLERVQETRKRFRDGLEPLTADAEFSETALTKDIFFKKLVDITKLRLRIERDCQEFKQEVRLGHYEGRGWRGLHHHAILCIAAYGFLISERDTISSSRYCPAFEPQKPIVSGGCRRRIASDPTRAASSKFNRYLASAIDRRTHQKYRFVPVMQRKPQNYSILKCSPAFMTQ